MKKKPIILFRKINGYEEEYKIASKYFNVVESIIDIPNKSSVIGRYSVIPYYNEVERDLNKKKCFLINSLFEHNYITEMSYVLDIGQDTPKTYFNPNDLPARDQEYILKGKTNSRKEQWKEKMYAPNKKRAIEIYLDLINEPYIGDQGIVFRDYVPLKKISESINGMPFTNEWRFFFYKDNLIDYNYYWSNSDIILKKEELSESGILFAKKIAKKVSKKVNFFVVDIAETENGDWILIELNDGQMSGLSEIDPENFYKSLSKISF